MSALGEDPRAATYRLRGGEEHDAEVPVGRVGPEARAVYAEHAGRPEQGQYVVFVGRARRQCDPRHGVEGSRRHHGGDPLDRVQALVAEDGALAQRVAERCLVRPVAAQRCDQRVLHRACAAQPAISQLLDRRQDVVEPLGLADREPARAPSGGEIRLRERRKGDDRCIGVLPREGGDRAVECEIGIDLVGEQRHVVPIGDLEQRQPRLVGVGGAGRVVRVDHDQRARPRGDEAAHVVEVGLPAMRCVCPVEDGARPDLGEHGRVQRIGRSRHEHFVPRLGQGGQRQLDPFRRARRDHYAVRRHRHAPADTLGGDGVPRGRDPDRRGVPIVTVAQRPGDRLDHVRRRLKTKGNGIPDVEIPHPRAGRLDPFRLRDNVPDGVGEPLDAAGDGDHGGSSGGHFNRKCIRGRSRTTSRPGVLSYPPARA
jgi:hypothetical protein